MKKIGSFGLGIFAGMFLSAVIVVSAAYPVVDLISPYLKTIMAAKIIKENYVEPYNEDIIQDKILGGIYTTLDEHSMYFNEEETKDFTTSLTGEFVGIGVTVKDVAGKGIQILEVHEGGPAFLAGMKNGEIIVEVNNKSVTDPNVKLDEKIKWVRGSVDSIANIIVLDSDSKQKKYTVVRKHFKANATKYDTFKYGDHSFGLLQIFQFQEMVDQEFATNIKKLLADGVSGLIIDLRENGGGELTATLKIASLFLKPESKIMSIVPREKENRETYVVDKNKSVAFMDAVLNLTLEFGFSPEEIKKMENMPIVVLVNKNSASASEVLAAALKENNRAIVFGEKTYGKGSVQTLFELIDGTVMKLTTAHYFTPNNNKVHKIGVTPNVLYDNNKKEVLDIVFEHNKFNAYVSDDFKKENGSWMKQSVPLLLQNGNTKNLSLN